MSAEVPVGSGFMKEFTKLCAQLRAAPALVMNREEVAAVAAVRALFKTTYGERIMGLEGELNESELDIQIANIMTSRDKIFSADEPQIFMGWKLKNAWMQALTFLQQFVEFGTRDPNPSFRALGRWIAIQKYVRARFFGSYRDFNENHFVYANGFLHNETGPAVRWAADEAAEYWICGRRFASLLHVLCVGDELSLCAPPQMCSHFVEVKSSRLPASVANEEKPSVRIKIYQNRIMQMYTEETERRKRRD